MPLKSYNQFLVEIAPLGNAAEPGNSSITALNATTGTMRGIPAAKAGQLNAAHALFDKILSSRPQQIKQIFMSAIARGDMADDPAFESEIKDLIRQLPSLGVSAKKSANNMMSKLERKKKREQDPLNNVVARTHAGPDGAGGDGGGEGGGE